MSADNYMLIDRKTFEVFHGFAGSEGLDLVKVGESLEEAVEIVVGYEKFLESKGLYVEYGTRFRN